MSHLRKMKAPMTGNAREGGEWPELSHCWMEKNSHPSLENCLAGSAEVNRVRSLWPETDWPCIMGRVNVPSKDTLEGSQ